MAVRDQYTAHIRQFNGIDQSADESLIEKSSAWWAENFETQDGNLTVAKGYVKHIDKPVPTDKKIYRLMKYHRNGELIFIVAAENELYAYQDDEWKLIKTYDEIKNNEWDYVECKLKTDDIIIIANGEYPLLKYDGTTATNLGTKLSTEPLVKYIEIMSERLFASGDAENKHRVYFSKAFDLDDWRPDANSPAVSGGHYDIEPSASEEITGLYTAFNSLLILKKGVMYYTRGTSGTNFVNTRIYGEMQPCVNTAITSHAETAYMLCSGGLETYNGISVQPHKTMLKIRNLMKRTNVSQTKALEYANKLYFTLQIDDSQIGNAILVYDTIRDTYMLRTGFTVIDMVSDLSQGVFIIGEERYVYKFNEGADYDGKPINAIWETPEDDMNAKHVINTAVMLYAKAVGEKNSSLVIRHIFTDPHKREKITKRLLPITPTTIRPIIRNYGRRVKLFFENENGKWFSLMGGIQIEYELEED